MARPKKNAAQAQDALPTLDTVPGIPVEEQPYPLPEGWKWVRLGQVYQINPKVIADDEKLASFIPMERIAPNMKGSFSFEILPWGKIKKGHTQFADGDVAFAKISPCFENGKSMLIKGLKNGIGAGTTELIILRQKYILQKYTFYLISNQNFIQKGICTYNGTVGQQRINMDFVRRYPIPLPPLEVQQRIVERIESLFAKLDEAREKAESALESFERRKAAILHKAFTGELTAHSHVSSKWKDKSAEELFTYVTSGSRGWAKYYAERGSIFIRMGNLSHKSIELDFSNIQYVLLPHRTEGQRTRLQKNDILISITADIGMVGIFRDDTAEAYINQHIALTRPSTNENAEFIAWYLISDVGLAQLKKKQRGTTKVGLGLDDIRSIHLKMPSLPEQQEIVRILDRIFAREQQAREAAENVLQRIDQMKKAILARAFRGELD